MEEEHSLGRETGGRRMERVVTLRVEEPWGWLVDGLVGWLIDRHILCPENAFLGGALCLCFTVKR